MDDLRALASDLRKLGERIDWKHGGLYGCEVSHINMVADRLEAQAEGADARRTGIAIAEDTMRCTRKALSCSIHSQLQLTELLAEILRYQWDRPIGVSMKSGWLRFVLGDNAVDVRAVPTLDWSGENENPTWVWQEDGCDPIQRELTHRAMAAAVLAFVTGDQRYEWDALYKRVPRADR